VIPVRMAHDAPLPDARLAPGIAMPAHVTAFAHLGLHAGYGS
jgi:hypothetical protein